MKASICIEMLFTDLPFLERIKKAAELGYDAVEFWNWDNKDMPAIKQTAADAGIKVLTFQSNRGGTLINAQQRDDFVAGIEESFDQANQMGVQNLFLLTDELGDDRGVVYQFPELSAEEKRASVLAGLKALAPLAEAAGVTLHLEPLNSVVDHQGYWLDGSGPGFDLIQAVNSPNIRLLFDIYHMQIMSGNLIETMLANLDEIGHIHVADVPGRHEPGTGEINYASIFKALRDADYQGYIGMEFEPIGEHQAAAVEVLNMVRN
jgi:hydroxypyruvate isomerase